MVIVGSASRFRFVSVSALFASLVACRSRGCDASSNGGRGRGARLHRCGMAFNHGSLVRRASLPLRETVTTNPSRDELWLVPIESMARTRGFKGRNLHMQATTSSEQGNQWGRIEKRESISLSEDDSSFVFASKVFVDQVDRRWEAVQNLFESPTQQAQTSFPNAPIGRNHSRSSLPASSAASTRRLFVASALVGAGLSVGGVVGPDGAAQAADLILEESKLRWEKSPINRRSGMTIFDPERVGYNVRFVTYLARFLLNFDEDCQRWWYSRAADIPRAATADKVDTLRLRQFGAFSASVEVGLQEYKGEDGPHRLLTSLLDRYCPDSEALARARASRGRSNPPSPSEERRQQREINEARRQIALLFGLMEESQPVEDITRILAAVDNATVTEVVIRDPGSGYAPGYGPPSVTFAPPEGGDDYTTARGRAVLRPNGRILRLDLVSRGFGYAKPPTITVSPPSKSFFANASSTATGVEGEYRAATAKPIMFRDGVNRGRIERIELIDAGMGYSDGERIRVFITPPGLAASEGGLTATATAILEYEVGCINIVDGGNGYAAEKPIPVDVEPPPLTARVNMNDPILAGTFIDKVPTKIPSASGRTKSSIKSRVENAAINDGVGGAGGCVGRACYDTPVVATAYARSDINSYASFRNADDVSKAEVVELAVERRSAASAGGRVVSGTSSGEDGNPKPLPFWGGGVSSSSLLSLLPSGIGLEYDPDLQRYTVSTEEEVEGVEDLPSNRPIDPEFGPRGRSPIERDKDLDISTLLRFCASGAICSSGVHLALTPIDVVKTKVQTNPVKYPGIIAAFKKVYAKGPGTFFTGWAPTFLGFLVWGAQAYATTEFFRRSLTEAFGENAAALELPIILVASGGSAVFGSVIISPFETVRIRSVAQPDYADSIGGVLVRLVKEEGVGSLFTAVPAFLLKEVPFACAKFTVFDLTTQKLYEAFPAAREDLQLSLIVSLVGGTIGGIVAAVVSNPADATISEMKKAKTDVSPLQAAETLLQRDGVPALFRGLGLRMFFYSLLVSLQFFVYDAVRFALGVGPDDLKLYLDVLGGALREGGGPV